MPLGFMCFAEVVIHVDYVSGLEGIGNHKGGPVL
jgi:hypothetical protein